MRAQILVYLFLISLIGSISSCKEEETTPPVNDPQDPQYNLNKSKDQVLPFEIVYVEVSGLSNLQNEYDGKFGNLNIKLSKGTGNFLFFIVPDISEGKHNLQLSLNNNARTLEFTVLKIPDIGDANSFFTNMIASIKKSLEEKKEIPSMTDLVSKQESLIALFETELAKLNNRELFETAGVILSNGLSKTILGQPQERYSWSCLELNGQLLLDYLSGEEINTSSINRLSQAPKNGVIKTASIGAILNMQTNYLTVHSQALDLLDCKILRNFELDESGSRIKTSLTDGVVLFESGVDRAFKLMGSYQSLMAGDRTQSNNSIAELAKAFDKVGEQLDKIIMAVNSLNASPGIGAQNLSLSDKINLPNNSEPEARVIENGEYSIQDINSDKVESKSVISTSDGVMLNFNSKVGGESEFGFNLVFEDGPLKVSKAISAKVTLECKLSAAVQVSGSSAVVQVKDGVVPVTYNWSNGGTGNSQSNLQPGEYSVTVKDNIGCEVTVEFKIEEVVETGTVLDRDGNEYLTVRIGTQTWMAENLRTSVYADGTAIPEVKPNTEWRTLTTGAFSWYNNDPGFDEIYGKLYNWYALDCCQICPEGWHVPNIDEWETLRLFLLPDSGGKMKTVQGWRGPNRGATNSSGFNGLPGGVRGFNGNFSSVTEYGHWWVAGETNATSARYMFLGFDTSSAQYASFNPKWNGASIRCIKD
jgi:uncharacterized protein (TIGR02145 family)